VHLEVALGKAIPHDHSRQGRLGEYLDSHIGPATDARLVVDLGCGAGELVRVIGSRYAHVHCVGVDIADSPGLPFVTFDGERLPFRSGSIDAMVSRQVLEHVRRPAPLFSEISRVLRPGGVFFGSTSQLEPYHSFSTWNYTPYGMTLLAEDSGLEALEFRPGADFSILVMRRLTTRRKLIDRWLDAESPLNRLIGCVGKLARWKPTRINAVKLMLAGQFFFVLRKP
jgi:SAM-dependent methyltransferase